MSEETKSLTVSDVKVEYDTKIIDFLLKKLSDIIASKGNINMSNIIEIATKLMQLVETYPKLKGDQKKTLVIECVKQFVKSNFPVDNEEATLNFIDLFLPSVIDIIISIDNSDIKIGVKKCFISCCK